MYKRSLSQNVAQFELLNICYLYALHQSVLTQQKISVPLIIKLMF